VHEHHAPGDRGDRTQDQRQEPEPSAARVASLVLGLGFTVFGPDGLLHFLPQPPLEGGPGALMGVFAASAYMLPMVKGTELVAGLLLVSNRHVPLALTLLAPVLANIVLFHAVLAPSGTAVGLVFLALELYLAWSYRGASAPMLAARVEPSGARADPRAEVIAAASASS
jgi:hypothetical protein